MPDELIFASNSIPLHFCLGRPDDQMKGTAYLPETTCGFQRVNLGIFEGKEGSSYQIYDLIDAVIAGTFCTGVQNTAMYLENYFKKVQYRFIIPYSTKSNALNYFSKEIGQLKSFLEKICNKIISPENLIESIEFYNKLRTVYQEIDKFRYGDHPLISLSEIQSCIYHLYLNGPDLNLNKINKLLDLIKNNDLPPKKGTPIFLSGNGALYNDDFVSLVENCNCIIAGDDIFTGSEFFSSLIQLDSSDPLLALANRYLTRNLSGRMMPDSFRIANILEICKERKIKALINNYLKFCDSYSTTADIFKKQVEREGISVLNLERDYSPNTFGQLKTRIEAFLEIMGS